MEYLLNKGVPDNQVLGRGYGKFEMKVANAQTEEDHRVNRRTEIKIISVAPIINNIPVETQNEGSSEEEE